VYPIAPFDLAAKQAFLSSYSFSDEPNDPEQSHPLPALGLGALDILHYLLGG